MLAPCRFTSFLVHDTVITTRLEQWVERIFQFYERYIREN